MRQTYRVLGYLIAIAVVIQAASIAFAWFSALNDLDSGLVIEEGYDGNAGHTLHSVVGMMVIPILALALSAVSFLTKVPGAVKWAGIVLLVVALQVTLAFISYDAPVVGALHGINAFAVAGVASAAASRVDRLARTEQTAHVSA